jgi:hypothetical protein
MPVKRLVPIIAALAAVAAAPAAVAATPSASAGLARCRVAGLQPSRYAVFTGVMSSLRSGNRMAIRFDLYRRAAGEDVFTGVPAPGLGVWNRANAGVPSYRFRQRVENLAAGASYRARVSFRWTGPAGKRREVLRKVTKACTAPDPRPELRLVPVSAEGVNRLEADYTVLVRNAGRGPAGSFDAALTVDGVSLPSITVNGLAARDRRQLTFRGPRCGPGGSVTATVDPDDRVDESDESDNATALACPARVARRG